MVITTRNQKTWTIPKGNIAKGLSASESAAKEAFEEAGIQGTIIKPNVGYYTYKKRSRQFRVKVFLMEVSQILSEWPEEGFRERKWITISKACRKIKQKSLLALLEDLEDTTVEYYQG